MCSPNESSWPCFSLEVAASVQEFEKAMDFLSPSSYLGHLKGTKSAGCLEYYADLFILGVGLKASWSKFDCSFSSFVFSPVVVIYSRFYFHMRRTLDFLYHKIIILWIKKVNLLSLCSEVVLRWIFLWFGMLSRDLSNNTGIYYRKHHWDHTEGQMMLKWW